jgi:hypothetical protein
MGRILFRKARPQDAPVLAQISKRAFHSDVHCGALPGPPGYDSPQWQRKMMRYGDYFTIVAEKKIVGGIIVFCKAAREYELGRIFSLPVDPNQRKLIFFS